VRDHEKHLINTFHLFIFSFYISVFTFSFKADSAELATPWQLKKQSGDVISSAQYKGKPVILHFG
jgi:cytochrome oxidase Cu insertion factor (SCO1/SenC/PrrC family)